MTAVDCSTLQVNYTVNPLPSINPLPSGDNNQVSLQDLEVKYQPILGGGSTGTRTVPLNGNPAVGVLCISGLTANTGYRVTYSAEVMTTLQITVPSDIPNPVEISTVRDCDQLRQCSECSYISCGVSSHRQSLYRSSMVVHVCILDVIHFVIILCVAEIFISIPTNTGNPGERMRVVH